MTDADLERPTSLEDLPPSSKLCYKALEYHDKSMTQKELAEETLLPGRSVRYALDRLQEIDVIEKRPSVDDARQSLYKLK